MRQAIHIFRKDARHCWPYIAGAMAITAVHAWHESLDMPDPQNGSLSGVLLALLMALAWWFAIGVAVHGESPVGDRQFWTTRPYSWKSLLASKLLFIVAFLAVPLFLSDCITLRASGYNPFTLIPGLLWRQCWFLTFLILPFVLAALTRATREFVLAGLVFYVVFWTALYMLTNHSGGVMLFGRTSWIADIAPWLVAVAGFSLVVWQYARRRTTLARVLAISLGGAVPLVMALSLGRMGEPAPAPRQDDPRYRNVAVQLAPAPGQANPLNLDRQSKGVIEIPVKFSGWPRDLMTCQLWQVSTTAPGTEPQAYGHTTGAVKWRPADPRNLGVTTASDGRESIWFSIDDSKTLTSKNVDLWVSVGIQLYERRGTIDLWLERGWTHVPGFGNVRLAEDTRGGYFIVWRTALKPGEPGWIYRLGDGKSEPVTDAGWSGAFIDLPASPAWFAISPVYSYPGVVMPTSGLTTVRPNSARSIPQPLVFTAKRLVATLRRELKIPNVRLADDETR